MGEEENNQEENPSDSKKTVEIMSILDSIKMLLGLNQDYTPFDSQLIVFINMAFTTLTQIGVGPSAGFKITSNEETWDTFIEDDPRLENVCLNIF